MTSNKRTIEQEETIQKIQKIENENENEIEKEELESDFNIVEFAVNEFSKSKYKHYIKLENLNFDLDEFNDFLCEGNDDGDDDDDDHENIGELDNQIIDKLFDFKKNKDLTINSSLRKLKGLAVFYKDIEDLNLKEAFIELIRVIRKVFQAKIDDPTYGKCSFKKFILAHKDESDDLVDIIKNCGLNYYVFEK